MSNHTGGIDMDASFERQLELESEMVGLGKKRYWDRVYKAREQGEESTTSYGTQIIKRMLEPLSASITAFIEEAFSGRPGPKAVAAKYLKDCDADTLAYIILKEAMNGATTKRPAQVVAIAVASAIEDEMRFRKFEECAKREWKWASETVNKQTQSVVHKRRVLMVMMARAAEENKELQWDTWEETKKLHIGIKCLDLVITTTGMFKYATVFAGKHKTETEIQPTKEFLDVIQDRAEFCAVLQPVYLPTIIPPKPWKNPYSGGYHSTIVRRLPMVKTKNKNYLEELANTAGNMPLVYQAVNAVQATAWRVNTKVLEVMQQVWDSGLVVKGIPSREDLPLPPKPESIATDKAVRREWKRAASKVYGKNAQIASKRLLAAKLLYMGEKFAKEPTIYFPMQLDFRGRMYAVPSYLNPQGCDAAKGLLTFSEGKPLDAAAMRWLKIHGANCYGEDKCSMDNRVKWVEENHDDIVRSGQDPITTTSFWADADKPWQFLAFCIEYAAVWNDPGYCSSLPVSVDGACNGLQHFSAMLRDSIGGSAVNLIPTQLPQDIYARVADVTTKKVTHDVTQDTLYSHEWAHHGITRKVTKRSVMVLPYGGTLYSSREFVSDYMVEVGLEWEDGFKRAAYLAKHIWSSIGDVVVAARHAMEWLQAAARAACDEKIPIVWTTPVGFPVVQAYADTTSQRIKTKIGGSCVKLILSQEHPTKLDRRRQCNGISPNFVHSMDACCLMLSTNRAADEGIRNFAMVHDSYGTLAADMDRMAVCLREAFVDMYQVDVLADFQSSILAGLSEENKKAVPPLPEKGDLNIEAVKDSVYFFA